MLSLVFTPSKVVKTREQRGFRGAQTSPVLTRTNLWKLKFTLLSRQLPITMKLWREETQQAHSTLLAMQIYSETWVSLPFIDICMLCHDSDYLLCIHSGLEKFLIPAGQAFESWEYKHIWINPRAKLQSQPESSMIEHVGQLIKLTHGIVTAWIYLPLIYVHVILNIIINSDGYSWQ